MNKGKSKIMIPIGLGLILILGISYAWLQLTLIGKNDNVLKAGTLSLKLDDTMTQGISVQTAMPTSDEVGKTTTPYHFTLTNDGTVSSKYTIYLDDGEYEETEEPFDESLIKINRFKHEVYDLTDKISELKAGDKESSHILDEGYIYPNKTYEFDIRLWLDSTIEDPSLIAGKVFRGKIRVEAEQLQPTPENCFSVDVGRKAISDYKCTEGNEYGLPVITNVVFPETVNGVKITGTSGNGALSNKGITSLYLPETFTSWHYASFTNNQISGALVIPDSVKGAGGDRNPFSRNQIETVEISKNMTSLLSSFVAFNNIRSVIIPNNIRQIDDGAFSNNKLENVTIPESVTTLGNAFSSNQLTSVTIKGKSSISEFESFGDNVFGWAKGSECETYYIAHRTEEGKGVDGNPCVHFEP